jgi:hypothetical protein
MNGTLTQGALGHGTQSVTVLQGSLWKGGYRPGLVRTLRPGSPGLDSAVIHGQFPVSWAPQFSPPRTETRLHSLPPCNRPTSVTPKGTVRPPISPVFLGSAED